MTILTTTSIAPYIFSRFQIIGDLLQRLSYQQVELYGKIEDDEGEGEDEGEGDLKYLEGGIKFEGGINNLDGISDILDNDDDIEDDDDDDNKDAESYIEIDTEEVFEQLSQGKAYVTFQGTYVRSCICIVIDWVYVTVSLIIRMAQRSCDLCVAS